MRRTGAEDKCDSRNACGRYGSCRVEEEDDCRGPVRRSDYWRDRSARDEKSQSIVVARIKNEDASEKGHLTRARLYRHYSRIVGLVFDARGSFPTFHI